MGELDKFRNSKQIENEERHQISQEGNESKLMLASNKILINKSQKKSNTPKSSYFNGANVSNFSVLSTVNSLTNFINISNVNKNLINQENVNIIQNNVNININLPENSVNNSGNIVNNSSNGEKSNGGGLTFSNSINNKKLIIFRKLVSNSPDKKKLPHFEELLTGKNLDTDKTKISESLKIPDFEKLINNAVNNKVNIVEKFQTISNSKIYLNELLTLKKSKITSSRGIVKKMLHAPSFRIYDVQEESINEIKGKENIALRDRINYWRLNLSQSKYLQKIYSSFWNSPEGCISVVMEPAKRGYLSVLN